MSTFDLWWYEVGSGITPIGDADAEQHARRVAAAAWEEALKTQCAEVERLENKLDQIEIITHRLVSWCTAYPSEIFIEITPPDWKRANDVLETAGISMTAMNASNMRHVINGVRGIAIDIQSALADLRHQISDGYQ